MLHQHIKFESTGIQVFTQIIQHGNWIHFFYLWPGLVAIWQYIKKSDILYYTISDFGHYTCTCMCSRLEFNCNRINIHIIS